MILLVASSLYDFQKCGNKWVGHLLRRTQFPTRSCKLRMGAHCTPRCRRSVCTCCNHLASCQRKDRALPTRFSPRNPCIRTASYVASRPSFRNHFLSQDLNDQNQASSSFGRTLPQLTRPHIHIRKRQFSTKTCMAATLAVTCYSY